jgi:hypothetical protein
MSINTVATIVMIMFKIKVGVESATLLIPDIREPEIELIAPPRVERIVPVERVY